MRLLCLFTISLIFISSDLCASTVKMQYAQIQTDTSLQFLLSDHEVQLESTDAINKMYNFEFEQADRQFRWLRQKYPWHPLPYFLLSLSQYWKMFPEGNTKQYDALLNAYIDTTIWVGKNLYDHHPKWKVEAAFFLSASHGLRGYFYAGATHKNWAKATLQAKTALRYLEICRHKNYLSPELLFGDALYNYFSIWIRENYPSLKPLLWLFKKGDKNTGLEQLKIVSTHAFYSRVEAMIWRMRILDSYEKDQTQALQLAKYLYRTFPNNPYFHRYYVRVLYKGRLYTEMEKQSMTILNRIDSAQFGYGPTSGRYASFFLGQLYQFRGHYEKAKKHYLKTIYFSEQNLSTRAGYYRYALLGLGDIYQKEGKKDQAIKFFKKAKKSSSRKDDTFKIAKKRLKSAV